MTDTTLLYAFIAYCARERLFKRNHVKVEDAVAMLEGFFQSEFAAEFRRKDSAEETTTKAD